MERERIVSIHCEDGSNVQASPGLDAKRKKDAPPDFRTPQEEVHRLCQKSRTLESEERVQGNGQKREIDTRERSEGRASRDDSVAGQMAEAEPIAAGARQRTAKTLEGSRQLSSLSTTPMRHPRAIVADVHDVIIDVSSRCLSSLYGTLTPWLQAAAAAHSHVSD